MVAVEITDGGVQIDALGQVKVHPAADLFPLLKGAEFDELVHDIRTHGLREPVVFTPGGELLDGRNRYRACKKLGDEPPRRVEHAEPWAYVISTNVHRRHLTESQRAMIAAKIAERRQGRPEKTPIGALSGGAAPLPPTKHEAADLLNVGTSSIDRARKVIQHGTKGLQQAVESGAVPVYTAARVASELDSVEQEKYVHRVNNGADPKKIAPPPIVSRPEPQAEPEPAPRNPRNGAALRDRYRYIQREALVSIKGALNGLERVLETTEGLSPDIDPGEAARWASDLTRARRHLAPLIKLLEGRSSE